MSDTRAIDHLDSVLADSTLRVRRSISEGLKIWQSKAGSYIAFTIITAIIAMILGFVPFLGQAFNSILIAPALTLGAYLYSNKVERGEDVEFGNLLDGFKFSKTIVVARILISIVSYLMMMLIFRNMFGNNWLDVMTGNTEFLTSEMLTEGFELTDFVNVDGMTYLYIIPFFLFLLFIYYTECFIGFYGLGAMDAMKYSAQFVMKHLIKVILLTIVVGLIVISGLIGIIIGILITASMLYPIFYRSFAMMTKLEEWQDEGSDDGYSLDDSLIQY